MKTAFGKPVSLGLAVLGALAFAGAASADSGRKLHDLPGVKGDYRIVSTPQPEPDDPLPAGPDPEHGYKFGNVELHIHGSISYEVGFHSKNDPYWYPRR